MQLIKKFIIRHNAEEILERTINLCGMEHLMPIKYLEEQIESYQNDLLEKEVEPTAFSHT